MSEWDGSRDFDFAIGTWDIHLRRLQRPLTGSTEWVDYEGTSTCRSIWGGRANLDEVLWINPRDGTRFEGLTLRLYNPDTREWSLHWANASNGTLGSPQKGRFVEGRGEFFDHDVYAGKAILVRYVWSDITSNSAHFEQAFSVDDGQTWETNWVSDQIRRPVTDAPDEPPDRTLIPRE